VTPTDPAQKLLPVFDSHHRQNKDGCCPISAAVLKQFWRGRHWKPGETFNVYVDSPFCVQECKFCFLKSTNLGTGDATLYEAYYKALIAELDGWRDVLRSHPIDTLYFGGGTSSLMRTDIMRSLFQMIPNVHAIQSKCFECDPLSLTVDKLNLLREYEFSYVTFGVQTLDKLELDNQRRRNPSIDLLDRLTSHALSQGLYVSYDVMAFLNDDLDQDIARFRLDLTWIMHRLQPTAIDVYPRSPALEGCRSTVLAKIRTLRRVLLEFADRYPDYLLADRAFVESQDIAFDERYRNYFLVRMDPNEYFRRVKSYSCSDIKSAPSNQNTAGFGGYGTRLVYSYLDEKTVAYRSRFEFSEDRFIYTL